MIEDALNLAKRLRCEAFIPRHRQALSWLYQWALYVLVLTSLMSANRAIERYMAFAEASVRLRAPKL